MNRFIQCILIFLLINPAFGCKGKPAEEGPSYEKIIAPATNVPSENAGEETPPDPEPLRTAVENAPDDPSVRFAYLIALRRAGQSQDALEQARILAEMDGEDNPFKSAAYLNFAEIVAADENDVPNRAELVREAMDGLWIALGWEPESVPAHMLLGRLALESGDDDKALHHLSIALAAVEIGYELRMEMSEIYIERGDMEKARAHLDEALRLAREAGDRAAENEIERKISDLS